MDRIIISMYEYLFLYLESLRDLLFNFIVKILGGARVWTGDLSICSRMLYHWATPPCVGMAGGGQQEGLIRG